jgi:tetratricopeptide (TPR) repeat protein
LPGYGIVLPFAVLGLIVYWRRTPLSIWLNLFLLSNVLGLVIVYVTARYRLPMTPVVIVYAAAGLMWLVEAVRDRRQEKVAPAMLLLLTMLAVAFVIDPGPACRTDFSQPLLNAARYYEFQGKPASALKALELLEQISPNHDREAQVLEMVGACAVDEGRYEDARRALARSIELDPRPASVYFHRGRLSYETGQYAAAEADLQRIAAIESDRAVVHYYLGAVYRALSKYALSIEALQKARDLQPELIGIYVELTQAYLALGDSARAVDALAEGLTRDPHNPELLALQSGTGVPP